MLPNFSFLKCTSFMRNHNPAWSIHFLLAFAIKSKRNENVQVSEHLLKPAYIWFFIWRWQNSKIESVRKQLIIKKNELWKLYNKSNRTHSFYLFDDRITFGNTNTCFGKRNIKTQINWKALCVYHVRSFDYCIYDLPPFWNLGNISLDSRNKLFNNRFRSNSNFYKKNQLITMYRFILVLCIGV